MYFVEILVSEGYQSHLWWVFTAVWGRQNNDVGQSLLEQSDRSRQPRMQSLSTSHALTSRSQSIFFLVAFASLWWSPKNGILCKAISFSTLEVFNHPATTHLLSIFPESFRAQNPLTITSMTERAARFGASWHDVTARSWNQTLSCVDSRSSSLGVAEAGTLKRDFGGENKVESKNYFWSS